MARSKGPLMINALADDLVMDRTTVGRNIRPLERDGLIRIESAPSDRRAKELHLTKSGEKGACKQGSRRGQTRKRASKQALAPSVPPNCGPCCGQSSPANSLRRLNPQIGKAAMP